MPFPLRRVLDPICEPVNLEIMKNYLRVDIHDDDHLIGTLTSLARERAEDLTARCLIPQQWLLCFDRFPGWWGEVQSEAGIFMHEWAGRHSMWLGHRLEILLPRGPVLSVDAINYTDDNGNPQTMDPDTYEIDLISEPARLRPVFNGSWPVALWDTNSVQILFTCGYQQTVTETHTMPTVAPFTVLLGRGVNAYSITTAVDATSGVAVAGTLLNGAATFAGATAGQVLKITYVFTNIPQSFIHAIKLLVGAWYENRAEVAQGGGNFNSMPMPLSATSLLATYQLFPVGYPKG